MKQTFKQASRLNQTFIRPNSCLKSKPMTDRKLGLGLTKICQVKLRLCKA